MVCLYAWGWGIETGVTVQGPLMSQHEGGLGCCRPQVNPRNPCRDSHAALATS